MRGKILRAALALIIGVGAPAAAACFEGLTAPLPESRTVVLGSGTSARVSDDLAVRVVSAPDTDGVVVDNLASGATWVIPASNDSASPAQAAVGGDHVVWTELRYDSRGAFRSTRVLVADARGGHPVIVGGGIGVNDAWPAISRDLVVWERSVADVHGTRIRVHDLRAGTTVTVPASGDASDSFPAVSGNRVVFERTTTDGGSRRTDVLLYDSGTGELRRLNPHVGSRQGNADIDGDIVTWVDATGGTADVVYRSLATGRFVDITPGDGHADWPRVAGSRIVWGDRRYGDQSDIYEYDLRTGSEKRVTFDPVDQQYADVSDHWLVWSEKGRSWRIVALRLPVGPTP